MIRLLADENFNRNIVRGLLRRGPAVDLVTAQDVGLTARDDPALLAWAADEGRVLLTHDVNTLVGFAHDRVAAGLPMAGVIAVARKLPRRLVIDELLVVLGCSTPDDWTNQVRYLPLR